MRLKSDNPIGAKSVTWLRDVAKVLNRRFDPDRRDRALVILAQRGMRLDEWKPLLLWHMTRDEFLVRDFLESWLFSARDAGRLRILAEDVESYLRSIGTRGGITEHTWSDTTTQRFAAGLLKIAADFGLLRSSANRQFASYH
ncbi:MAG: BrxA family protein, partial [Acetobacteraceae bacterium]